MHGADANANINSTQSADANVNAEVSSAASADANIKFLLILFANADEYANTRSISITVQLQHSLQS